MRCSGYVLVYAILDVLSERAGLRSIIDQGTINRYSRDLRWRSNQRLLMENDVMLFLPKVIVLGKGQPRYVLSNLPKRLLISEVNLLEYYKLEVIRAKAFTLLDRTY